MDERCGVVSSRAATATADIQAIINSLWLNRHFSSFILTYADDWPLCWPLSDVVVLRVYEEIDKDDDRNDDDDDDENDDDEDGDDGC